MPLIKMPRTESEQFWPRCMHDTRGWSTVDNAYTNCEVREAAWGGWVSALAVVWGTLPP